jgi:hypothetical protein
MRFLPIRKACLGLLLFSLAFGAALPFAQAEQPYTQDFQTWQFGVMQGHITKRILGYFDTQVNTVNLTQNPNNSLSNKHAGQLLIRPAIGLQLTKGWSIWQGYGWTPNFQPEYRNENQLWEQLVYQHCFKHLNFSNRTRFEIRRIYAAGGTALRLRNQVRLAVPLGKTRWSLVAFDEPFFNLNTVDNGPRAGFNQNWAFLGIGRRLTKSVNLDIGYLNNYVRNFAPVPDRMNHVIFAALNINVPGTGFDLRKPNATKPSSSGPAKSSGDSPNSANAQELTPAISLLPVVEPNLEIAPVTRSASQAETTSLNTTPVSASLPSTGAEVPAVPNQ